MTPRSLVFRLSLLQQIMAVALIVTFASLAIWISAGTLRRQETDYVSAVARQIAASFEKEWTEEGNLAAAANAVFEETVPSDVWVDMFDESGERVASTVRGRRPEPRDQHTLRVHLPHGASVVVSVSSRSRHRAISALSWALLLTAIPLLGASVIASRILARRTLAPLSRLTAEADGAIAHPVPLALTVTSDPTEIVTLSRAFDRLLGQVHEMLRAEKNFSQDAAHELRTPLTVLSGELEMALADPALPERHRYGLGRAMEQARSMSELVEALLLLKRADLSTAQPAGDWASVDLGHLVRDIATELRQREPSRASDLDVVAADGAVVLGNSTLLAAAVRNLLGNAFKFTDTGQPVRVAVASAANTASIVVEDGGPGVPLADRERIFDPFYRGGEARASRDGVGLGLPIILRVARAHGGEVNVSESRFGGAKFVFRLPVARRAA